MSIFTIVFAFLAFAGIIIAMQAVTAKPRQDLIAERLAQYRDHNLTLDEIELSLPFSERFIKPVLERLGSLLTARMAKNRQVVVQNKINLAGRPYALSVNGLEVVKVIVGIVIALVALGLVGVMGVTSLPLKGAALGVGFLLGRFLPDVWLNNKIKGRQKELRLALPNALDLLTISVEAGLGFDAAIGRLTEKFKNALSDEFAQVLNEIRLGRPRLEALDDMGRRSGVEELHTFIQALIQSEQLGVGIAKVLRIQSEEMRRRRRQRAEEQAAQAPLKMLFPMIGCIFPTLFIVLMGRARLPENSGLVIDSCNGIHMMFMRFPIDAVFVDKKGVVLKPYERLLPWIGIVPLVWRADKVAELPVGTIRRHAIKPGDQLLVA